MITFGDIFQSKITTAMLLSNLDDPNKNDDDGDGNGDGDGDGDGDDSTDISPARSSSKLLRAVEGKI